MTQSPFNKVVFHPVDSSERNIHIAVHPFPCDDVIRLMESPGDYGRVTQEPLTEWKRRLADALFEGIPGLTHLFFTNGNITIQHAGIFSQAEILAGAEAIVRPVLEVQLALSLMWTGDTEPADDDYWGRPESEWWGLS
jgi:hypothetical protein